MKILNCGAQPATWPGALWTISYALIIHNLLMCENASAVALGRCVRSLGYNREFSVSVEQAQALAGTTELRPLQQPRQAAFEIRPNRLSMPPALQSDNKSRPASSLAFVPPGLARSIPAHLRHRQSRGRSQPAAGKTQQNCAKLRSTVAGFGLPAFTRQLSIVRRLAMLKQ